MKLNYVLILFSVGFLFGCGQSNDTQSEKPRVSVVLPVTIDAFEDLKAGIVSVLGDSMSLRFYSAEGDPSKFETSVQSALLKNPDYLICIGTQITNTALGPKFKASLPTVVSGAISSPELVEGLIKVGLEPPRKLEVAIVSDSPKKDIYQLLSNSLQDILHNYQKVGVIYNPGEVNSQGTALKSAKALEEFEKEVVFSTVNSIEDVENCIRKLILEQVDVVLIPHDKNAVTKASTIVKMCNEARIPVVALDDGTVRKDGVAIGISVNYNQIGKLIGETVLSVDTDELSASKIPIVSVDNASIYFNRQTCENLGIQILENQEGVVVY